VPTKILVADDSATMRRVLEMTFAGEDASVVTVDGADAALHKLGEFGPDVVFVDAALPGVDGYEIARRIKAQPNQAKVAVIVMASQHNPYDDNKGRAVGVDDHISKPFDTQSVIDRVGQVLARPRNQPAAAEGARPAVAPAAARPAAPAVPAAPAAPVPAAPNPPARVAQGTRIGMGAPVPLAPAAAAAQAGIKPAPQPVPAAPLRPAATVPMAPGAPQAVAKPAAPPVPEARARESHVGAPRPQATAPAVSASVGSAAAELGDKLGQLGLSREQVEGVLALSREVIEQVVWEVVPQLAEQLIKEELKRLTAD
jgi:CheY-like chemotaxis protein